MFDNEKLDTLGDEPFSLHTVKRLRGRAAKADRRYVQALRDVARENARREKREERAA